MALRNAGCPSPAIIRLNRGFFQAMIVYEDVNIDVATHEAAAEEACRVCKSRRQRCNKPARIKNKAEQVTQLTCSDERKM